MSTPKKMPPFLMGVTLIFWGWQSHLLFAGALMAVVIESARWVQTRWELNDRDFNRIWTFCTLLLLTAAVYAFTQNEGPSHFGGFFQHPDIKTERGVGTSTARTMAQIIRWLPMTFFMFIAAQQYSTRGAIPLETISLILRWQWKKAKALGQPLPASRNLDISYVYFALCLLSASVHSAEDTSFFWGMCVLVAWGLWRQRARNALIWTGSVGIVVCAGYFGQGGLGRMRIYIESFNPPWLSTWPKQQADPSRSKTALGQVGRIKSSSSIVMRLEPHDNSHPPQLLREASYRDYKSPNWTVAPAREDGASGEAVIPEKTKDAKETTFLLLPNKTNLTGVSIACYLDRPTDVLPLPEGVARVENLPVYTMKKTVTGAVLVEGPGLVIFDAFYGPGETIDGPPEFKEDLAIRNLNEIAAINKVVEEYHLQGADYADTLRKVSAFFETYFSYSTWQDRPILTTTNETPLTRFLLKSRKGHCEYFATATVLVLRRLGIPARYAVGYSVHEASGKKYLVRQRDAHAWCLVWNRARNIWENFDTTPASWLETEEKHTGSLQFLSDAWSGFVFQIAKLRWGQTHLREYILWGLAPMLGFLLYQILARSRRKRADKNGFEISSMLIPGLDSEFYELERKLLRRGMARERSEPMAKWLQRASRASDVAVLALPLQKLLALHYRYRFDPNGLNAVEREILRRQARECLQQMDTK